MSIETLNKLYLELSQVVTAKTAREHQLEYQVEYARKKYEEYEDLLMSAMAIAERDGRETHWERWRTRLRDIGIRGTTPKTFRFLPSDTENSEGAKP